MATNIDSGLLGDLLTPAAGKFLEILVAEGTKRVLAIFQKVDTKRNVTVALVGEAEDTLIGESEDVPILVQVTQPAYLQVRRVMRKKGITTAILMITNELSTNDERTEFRWGRLDPNNPEEWSALARELNRQIQSIQAKYGAKTYHLFLSTPSSLAFAMGTLVKDLHRVHIYQFDAAVPDQYVEVINAPADLR